MTGILPDGSGDDRWVRDSLFAIGGIYTPLQNGAYVYFGSRPGPEWYGHGYFSKSLTMLVDGNPEPILVYKHRWVHKAFGYTVHSRPPDDPVLIRFCSLILMLRVWGVVNSTMGFHNRRELFEGLENGCGSDRTVQRWVSRALDNGMEIQQAVRLYLIEESEPRPVERLYVGGLSPPDAVISRRWKSPANLETLYAGYAMLLVTASKLYKHASTLLAGARRRWPNREKTFGF